MRHLVRSRSEQDRVTELIEQQTAISEVLRGRSDLPIYLFSGSEDPVGQQLRGLHKLIARYRDAGLSDIAFDFYPGGRHEMLNEINRRQVQTRLLSWISQTLEKLSGDDRRVSTALELQH